jgi:Fe2+ or Zn2+ uptake regulation protein
MEHIFSAQQRFIILDGLERAPGREYSNEMLQHLLRENFHRLSISEVNELIAWLENRGYVKVSRLGESGFMLAHITRAGIDVALGNTRAEGIEPPPED